MSEKTKKSKPFKIHIQFQHAPQGGGQKDPSPAFVLVTLGLVAYILDTAKIVTITGLHFVSISFVVIGFVMLIIDTLGKVKFH